jgi:hypothetical protein
MGYGDEILAAGQAQRYFDAYHEPVTLTDLHNRPRWHPIWDGNPAIVRPADVTADTPRICSAQNARPYIIYPFTAESGWTFDRRFRARDHIARIYLTEDERRLGASARKTFGDYVLVEPWSKHDNLRWPREHWQAFVDQNSHIRFVQHTHAGTDYVLSNVIPIETRTFREACGLLVHAHAYVRGESGMLHAAAALGVPAVAIWGNCMDWDVLGAYPTHIGVGVSPQLPCGSYLPCRHCARTMAAIEPFDVSLGLASALALPTSNPDLRNTIELARHGLR